MQLSISVESLLSLLVLIYILWVVTAFILTSSYSRARKSLPPGPFQLPIIGNILALGSQPHRSLTTLSRKYGPIMSLKLGSITAIIISSPEAAKCVLQKHDSVCSSRPLIAAAEPLSHHTFSMAWLPVEHQWRKLRKICKEHLFSAHRLDASQDLRTKKLEKLCDYVRESCESGRAVDIGDAVFITSLNLMAATLFSMEFAPFDSNSSQEMKEVVSGMTKCFGKPNFADYFSVLKVVDPQGIFRETKVYCQKLLDIFDVIIDEKLKSRSNHKINHDLVDSLIEINQRDEAELSRDDIKHLLLDLFAAGTDAPAGVVEWAMTELLRNPDKISMLRDEINTVVGENDQIQESDISRLSYLQAVVKETFRLHPIAPLLVPRKAGADIEINGYIIPRNAQIIFNVWASGRDLNIWPNADSFIPERFLEQKCSKINFRGQDFELIPFGAGRRICPGLPLAHRTVHSMLATLVHKFGWKLMEGTKPREIDMSERFGITLQKAIPLRAIPTKL